MWLYVSTAPFCYMEAKVESFRVVGFGVVDHIYSVLNHILVVTHMQPATIFLLMKEGS